MMMMFQLYTELPSGNLSPGSEICGCQEGGQLKCTMLEEVIIINVLTNNLFFKVIKCCEYQPDWRGFQELVLHQVQQIEMMMVSQRAICRWQVNHVTPNKATTGFYHLKPIQINIQH